MNIFNLKFLLSPRSLRLRGALLLTCLSVSVVACHQSNKKYVPTDPAKLGMIPQDAHVVAETGSGYHPLLFVAPADGTVWFFANDDLLATIGVKEGQRIELNSMEAGKTNTIISIDGKPQFKVDARAQHNRLFYAPAVKPVVARVEL
jgi:hypothetical protein